MAGRGTPATALLEKQRVAHTLHSYEHDPRHESYGLEAADALGLEPGRVFKTLVAEVDGTARGRRRAGHRAARPEGVSPPR